jgi:hypothetical protein
MINLSPDKKFKKLRSMLIKFKNVPLNSHPQERELQLLLNTTEESEFILKVPQTCFSHFLPELLMQIITYKGLMHKLRSQHFLVEVKLLILKF